MTPDQFEDLFIPEPNTGCWLFTGRCDRQGYGRLWHNGKTIGAHRYSYAINVGLLPAGSCVLHRCDTPTCVNYRHLYLGSVTDNHRDMVEKNRHARMKGERNGSAVLTDLEILNIRRLLADGISQRAIGAEFRIAQQTVSSIKNRTAWAHLPDEQAADGRSPGRGALKLSEDQVTQIRRRLDAGETQDALAAEYGVVQAHISRIKRGKARPRS